MTKKVGGETYVASRFFQSPPKGGHSSYRNTYEEKFQGTCFQLLWSNHLNDWGCIRLVLFLNLPPLPHPTLNSSEGKVTHIIDRHVTRPDNLGGTCRTNIWRAKKNKVGYNFLEKYLIYRPFLQTLLHIYRPTCYFTHLATNSGGLSWFFVILQTFGGTCPPRPPWLRPWLLILW